MFVCKTQVECLERTWRLFLVALLTQHVLNFVNKGWFVCENNTHIDTHIKSHAHNFGTDMKPTNRGREKI